MFNLHFEVYAAAMNLMKNMFKIKEGESIAITADSTTNENIVNASASAAVACGAKPMVIWLPKADGVGKATDAKLPVEALSGALSNVDCWVEFNTAWLLYSTPFEVAVEKNKRLRYLNLVEMDEDLFVKIIGNTDLTKLIPFMEKLTDMTQSAKSVRIKTDAGTDISFKNEPSRDIYCDVGDASKPGLTFMPGQICWFPNFDTINGKIVFDGSINPPCGLLDEPVEVIIENGYAKEFSGGRQAKEFENWLKGFNHENMLRPVHVSYGVLPSAELSGKVAEDERVWGCTQWGFGYLSPIDAPPEGVEAPSHTDGICLNSSVWLDDKQIMDRGKFIEPELKELADELLNK